MTRVLFDGVNPGKVLEQVGMHAGYVDGKDSQWPNSFLAKCEVRISAVGTNNGNVCDVERGDLTPEQAFDWVLMRRREGVWGSVYVNKSNWQQVRDDFTTARVIEPPYWVADWTNVQHTLDGAVAVQWTSGDDYDTSLVSDYWMGVDDVVNPLQLTGMVAFNDGTIYVLRASGEVEASRTTPGDPAFHVYTIKGDDGSFYTFGPGLNNGVFAYPGLPAGERLGVREFYEIRAGSGRW